MLMFCFNVVSIFHAFILYLFMYLFIVRWPWVTWKAPPNKMYYYYLLLLCSFLKAFPAQLWHQLCAEWMFAKLSSLLDNVSPPKQGTVTDYTSSTAPNRPHKTENIKQKHIQSIVQQPFMCVLFIFVSNLCILISRNCKGCISVFGPFLSMLL